MEGNEQLTQHVHTLIFAMIIISHMQVASHQGRSELRRNDKNAVRSIVVNMLIGQSGNSL